MKEPTQLSGTGLKIAFVIGPCPDGRCGVGDYTRILAHALEGQGVKCEIVRSPDLSRIAGTIKTFRPHLLHLQYPTAGFGKRLTPQRFALQNQFVLTAHEFAGTHLLRRLAFYPLWLRARHVIFTTESNREYALNWAPWLRTKNSLIPLSTNIPVTGPTQRASNEVIHFGLVRPNKGIEDVLQFAYAAQAEGLSVNVRIVGSPQAGDGHYLRSVQRLAKGLPITWELNLPAHGVGERLARATIAYQPYPDGASEKRASLLAALANGIPVITRKGTLTPPGMESAVCFATTPTDAITAARRLFTTPSLRRELAERGTKYAQRFSWDTIAAAHISVYHRVLGINANRD